MKQDRCIYCGVKKEDDTKGCSHYPPITPDGLFSIYNNKDRKTLAEYNHIKDWTHIVRWERVNARD